MERISEYVEDIDYASADSAAARLLRGITTRPVAWETLIATAQRILGHFQNEASAEVAEALYYEEAARPLIAAARILHAAAGASRNGGGFNYEETSDLAWLAMGAYAAHGNFPGAHACARLIEVPESELDAGRTALRGLFSPTSLGPLLANASHLRGTLVEPLLGSLNAFVTTGEMEFAENARDALEEMLRRGGDPFDIALLRTGKLALRHQCALSTARLLKAHADLSDEVAESLAAQAPPTLLPPQRGVIERGFLTSRKNALVTLPTSTGKTLLAQFALISTVLRYGNIGVFVAPYVTVATQTTDSFRRLASGLPIRVIATSSADQSLRILHDGPQILIVTPERLNELLNTELSIDQIGTIVIDEVHLIESGARGALLEGLLARFRLRQTAGTPSRIILMSAVVANADALRTWIAIDKDDHFHDSWRPTARRIAFWTQDGRLQWLYGTDPVRPIGAQSTALLGSRSLPLVERMYATEQYGQIRSQLPASYSNVSYLTEFLLKEVGGPVLAVCMTKRATRGIARSLASKLPELEPGVQLRRLEVAIVNNFPHLAGLLTLTRHGVAYHNASVPATIRVLIERAVGSRELVAVASTTTLAEGADLPFRAAVLCDWLQWRGEEQQPISPLLFRNIAGRSGRAGSFVEGDTIMFENVLGPLRFTRESSRRQYLFDIVDMTPTLRSAFDLAEGESETRGIEANIKADFVAAIAENPTSDELVESYMSHTYHSSRRGVEKMRRTVVSARDAVLDSSEGSALGVAASPIRLTPLGKAVHRAGISPGSARDLLRLMVIIKTEDIDDAVAALLVGAAEFPELSNVKVRKVLSGRARQHPVKVEDLAVLGGFWRSGRSLVEVFTSLPFVARSRRKPTIDTWLAGEPAESWDEAYDNFIDFVEAAFGSYAPKLLRACERLKDFSLGATCRDWLGLALQYELRADPDAVDVL